MADIVLGLKRAYWQAHRRSSALRRALATRMERRVRIGNRVIGPSNSVGDFYAAYFGSPAEKCLVQVGANDGIMCDPLRRYLAPSRQQQNFRAVLIEPIPFYCDRLRTLYADYPNITVINAACGAAAGSAPLYYIDPAVADRMNGNGPANDWAHGQGSFDRAVVEYWIERNRFRGEDYVREIDTFHAAIRSIDVSIMRLADVPLFQHGRNILVVMDVQGFEFDVIRGIAWNFPPSFIVFEDDLKKSDAIGAYLAERGFTYLCGRTDKVYMRT